MLHYSCYIFYASHFCIGSPVLILGAWSSGICLPGSSNLCLFCRSFLLEIGTVQTVAADIVGVSLLMPPEKRMEQFLRYSRATSVRQNVQILQLLFGYYYFYIFFNFNLDKVYIVMKLLVLHFGFSRPPRLCS